MPRLHFLFACLFFLLSFSVNAQTAANVAKAETMMKDGKFKQAKKFLTGCINKEVTNPEYFYYRSICCFTLGDADGAFADIGWAIKLGPDSMKYRMERAGFYVETIQSRKAMPDYEASLRMAKNGKDSSAVLGKSGHCRILRGDTAQGIRDMELAVRLDSMNLDAMNNLAMSLNDVQRTPESIALLQKVLALDSTYVFAYSNLGFCYTETGEYAKAISCFDYCIRTSPFDAIAYNNRGYAKLKNGDTKGALADVQKSIRLFPSNSYAYRNLGLIYLDMGEKEKACEAFEKALLMRFTESYGPEVMKLKRENCK